MIPVVIPAFLVAIIKQGLRMLLNEDLMSLLASCLLPHWLCWWEASREYRKSQSGCRDAAIVKIKRALHKDHLFSAIVTLDGCWRSGRNPRTTCTWRRMLASSGALSCECVHLQFPESLSHDTYGLLGTEFLEIFPMHLARGLEVLPYSPSLFSFRILRL